MDELLNKDIAEGPEAFDRFDALVGKVLTVSREDLARREERHKRTAHLRGKKRGPKPKGAPGAAEPVPHHPEA